MASTPCLHLHPREQGSHSTGWYKGEGDEPRWVGVGGRGGCGRPVLWEKCRYISFHLLLLLVQSFPGLKGLCKSYCTVLTFALFPRGKIIGVNKICLSVCLGLLIFHWNKTFGCNDFMSELCTAPENTLYWALSYGGKMQQAAIWTLQQSIW